MSKKQKIILATFFIILFLLLLFSIFFSLININNTNILKSISVNGIDISNMTKDEAFSTISNYIEKKKNSNLILEYPPEFENTTITFDYLNINYDITSCINQAYNIGRSGNIFKNNFEILNLLIHKKDIKIDFSFDENSMKTLSNDLSSNLENKVIQSSYYIENNNLIITKGHPGDIIDEEDFSKKIQHTLEDISSSSNFIELTIKNAVPKNIDIEEIYNEIHKDVKDAYYEENPFKVYPETIGISFDINKAKTLLEENQDEYVINLEYAYPKITINDLNVNIFRDKLSVFTTYYNTSNKDRSTNLELAAQKINGTILAPGEEFSYNLIVGVRTIEAGYKEAKIYSNGKVIDGVGGGICQLSSTLYNSAFLANLEITERYNHQFLTSYVDEGKDATVVYGVKDLKFKNNRTFPIKIETKVSSGVVSCFIYGLKEETEYDVSFNVETVSTVDVPIKYEYDSSLNLGEQIVKQSGSKGMTVNVYKVLKLDGKIVSKTFLYQDVYKPLERVVLSGNKNNEETQ